jgi:hypothetical protein
LGTNTQALLSAPYLYRFYRANLKEYLYWQNMKNKKESSKFLDGFQIFNKRTFTA